MDKNPDNINLEWYHHMKCWKTFCDEGKIRRQQRKEEKGEGTSSKGPTSTEVSPEVETLPQRKAHVLPEICIICGRDASWFSLDKVGAL